MIRKIKLMIASLMLSLGMGAPALVPLVVYAAPNTIQSGVCTGSKDAASEGQGNCTVSGNGEDSIASIAHNVVNIFSIIVGVVAIIMIIWGGFRYITSGGDSGRVGSAKNTLIYAIIGLIIVALAQFIVNFVLTKSTEVVQ